MMMKKKKGIRRNHDTIFKFKGKNLTTSAPEQIIIIKKQSVQIPVSMVDIKKKKRKTRTRYNHLISTYQIRKLLALRVTLSISPFYLRCL